MSDYFLRASSVADMLDCAARWEGSNLLKLWQPTNFRAHTGTALHHGANVFDSALIEGNPIKVDEAVGAFVELFNNPDEEVDWTTGQGERVNKGKLEAQGCLLMNTYCSKETHNHHWLSVEQNMPTTPIEMDNGVTINLTGTVDRIRGSKKDWGITDLKSTSRPGQDYKAQIAVYSLLGRGFMGTNPGLPAQTIEMKTVGDAEVYAKNQETDLTYLLGNIDTGENGVLDFVAFYLKAGVFPPNPRSNFCHTKYCPRYNIPPGTKGYCKFKNTK